MLESIAKRLYLSRKDTGVNGHGREANLSGARCRRQKSKRLKILVGQPGKKEEELRKKEISRLLPHLDAHCEKFDLKPSVLPAMWQAF